MSSCFSITCWTDYLCSVIMLCQRSVYNICMWLFIGFLLCSVYLSILSPVTHCLYYCSARLNTVTDMLLIVQFADWTWLLFLFSCPVLSNSEKPWTAACKTSLSFIIPRSLLKLMSIESGCHPTISFSDITFYSCFQSFPVSESFLMSQFFASGGQSIGTSISELVLPINIQGWICMAEERIS